LRGQARSCPRTLSAATGTIIDHGRVTRLTAINAKWLLDRDGELIAALRDGRQLRLQREDVQAILR
jgi:hypothetical protein